MDATERSWQMSFIWGKVTLQKDGGRLTLCNLSLWPTRVFNHSGIYAAYNIFLRVSSSLVRFFIFFYFPELCHVKVFGRLTQASTRAGENSCWRNVCNARATNSLCTKYCLSYYAARSTHVRIHQWVVNHDYLNIELSHDSSSSEK